MSEIQNVQISDIGTIGLRDRISDIKKKFTVIRHFLACNALMLLGTKTGLVKLEVL